MREINRDQFLQLLERAPIKPKFYKDVRFMSLPPEGWHESEFVVAPDRTEVKGIFLTQIDNKFFATPYELMRRVADKQTGRSKPITCDLCLTWQAGSNAGRITFVRQNDGHSFTFLCCADLACSKHIRDKTPASALSRSQIREDLTPEQRIERLKNRLSKLVYDLRTHPINDSDVAS